MHVFTDADGAGDVLTRSTTGYVVFAAGVPLAWQSKLQTIVATSSMQSEYQAMTMIHVRIEEQTADIFTKALTGPAFDTHRRRMFGTER